MDKKSKVITKEEELVCVDLNHEGVGVVKSDGIPYFVSNLLPYPSILVSFVYYHYMMGKKPSDHLQEKYLIDYLMILLGETPNCFLKLVLKYFGSLYPTLTATSAIVHNLASNSLFDSLRR